MTTFTGEWAGAVFDEDGGMVEHCATSSGMERWRTCEVCGGRIVDCFECGSIDRGLTTCDCEWIHTARSHS